MSIVGERLQQMVKGVAEDLEREDQNLLGCPEGNDCEEDDRCAHLTPLNHWFIFDRNGELAGIQAVIAQGVPTIRVDTRSLRVEGWWGAAERGWPFSQRAGDRINRAWKNSPLTPLRETPTP